MQLLTVSLGSQTGSVAAAQGQISPSKSAGWRLTMWECITAGKVQRNHTVVQARAQTPPSGCQHSAHVLLGRGAGTAEGLSGCTGRCWGTQGNNVQLRALNLGDDSLLGAEPAQEGTGPTCCLSQKLDRRADRNRVPTLPASCARVTYMQSA